MTNNILVKCPVCHRVVDEKHKYCAYCAFRLLNEDGSRREVPEKVGAKR